MNCAPLLYFRRTLQTTGLLRKHKGRLLLTRAGAAAQRDPTALWKHLASRLLPGAEEGFDAPATLLLLLYAATNANADPQFPHITSALNELGWRHSDGQPLSGYELYRLPAFDVLANVGGAPKSEDRSSLSPAASALAREALRGPERGP